jgi:group I intron endonuclease
MKETGIYIIKNTVNGKIYIGSSSYNIYNRITVHKRFLKQNKHENLYLQASYNKHGKDAFVFEILELCDKSLCIEREQYYLDLYQSYKRHIGYNINEKANSRLGSKYSEESKEKMRIAKLGKKLSNEHILKSKLSRTGQKRKQETIELQNIKKFKKVLQFNLNGDFIKEWNSLKEVEEFFNKKGAIGNCIRRGFNYNSCGYKWKYK